MDHKKRHIIYMGRDTRSANPTPMNTPHAVAPPAVATPLKGSRPQPLLRYVGRVLLVVLAYFVAGRMGLALPYQDEHITLIWLPTGIAVATLYLWGARYTPAVWLGALLTNASIGVPLPVAAGMALGNTLGPGVAVLMLRKAQFNCAFFYSRDVLLLVLAAVVGMLVPATVGLLSLHVGGLVTLEGIAYKWALWWMGDSVGVLLAAPLLFSLSLPRQTVLAKQWPEVVLLAVVFCACNWLIFMSPLGQFSLAFIPVGLLIWVGLRFGVMGTSLAVMVTAAASTWGLAHGSGPFARAEHGQLVLWVFMTAMAVVGLGMTALQSASKRTAAELQQSEQKLRDSEETYRLAVQGIAGGVWNWSETTGRLDFSQQCEEILDMGGAPLPNSLAAFFERFHPDDKPKASAALVGHLKSHLPLSFDCRVRLQNNTYRWLSVSGQALWNAQGRAYRVAGSLVNIHERKLAEEALQLASMVYLNSGEAMVVSDQLDRVIAINPAFTLVTGYELEAVVGKKISQFSSLHHNRAQQRSIRQALHTQNTWKGELWNQRKGGEDFASWVTVNVIRNAHGAVHRHVYLFSDVTGRKRADELIQRQANFDQLTGLPNRSLFREQLDMSLKNAARAHSTVALLFIDLDLFKEVNDTLGHDVGDTLLVEAANRIKNSVRDTDMVARLGGDEFTVILSNVHDLSPAVGEAHDGGSPAVAQVAQKILHRLAEPFYLNNDVAHLSASIGITLYPEDSRESDGLLKNADQAMYVAKNEGRNSFSFFTRSIQERAQTRLRLSNDLRSALASKQLEVYFQPIIHMADGSIDKAEALLRWNHPTRGMISPTVFIPIAEESGLINEVGDWVFKQSAAWAQRWSAQRGRPLQISVNKSPKQFSAQNRAVSWPEQLAALGLSGECIAVEITEGLLLNAAPLVNQKLEEFLAAGVQVSIDDFGTGYSSMAYLKKFNIDYLKIDQSFVRDMGFDPGDRAIVEAIVGMAHKLGYKVIAEGIETEEQKSLLMAVGCDYGQGYLFAPPMPAQDFERLLTKGVPAAGADVLAGW